MSLVSLDNIALILSDLNSEVTYKVTENGPTIPQKALILSSDGENHRISLFQQEIWNSEVEKELENIPPEKELVLNERENFEAHLRLLINDKINSLKTLEM